MGREVHVAQRKICVEPHQATSSQTARSTQRVETAFLGTNSGFALTLATCVLETGTLRQPKPVVHDAACGTVVVKSNLEWLCFGPKLFDRNNRRGERFPG